MKYVCIKNFENLIKEGDIIIKKEDKYILSREDDIIIEVPEEVVKDTTHFRLSDIKVITEKGGLDDQVVNNYKIVINVKCTEKELLEYRNKIYKAINN